MAELTSHLKSLLNEAARHFSNGRATVRAALRFCVGSKKGTRRAEHASKSPRNFSEYLVRTTLASAQELRGLLDVSESSFLQVVPWSHSDARSVFIYSCVDEVTRVASAMLRWHELSPPSAEDPQTPRTEEIDPIARTAIGAIQTEQSLWLRKLLECAVDVICFQETNDDAYYRHYILVRQLERRLHYVRELADFFFGQNSANIEYGNQSMMERIRQLEQDVDLQRCWYLKQQSKLSSKPKPPLASNFNARLKRALVHATAVERLQLGLTYRAYSGVSENIHFNVGETHASTGDSDVRRKADRCGMLAACILIRCHRLADVQPQTDITRQMHNVLGSDETARQALSLFTVQIAQPGDFVSAMGGLAELLEAQRSAFGYFMYKVAYFADAPIDGIDEEWVPPEYVRPLFSRRTLLSQLRETLAREGVDLDSVDAEFLKSSLRASAVELWNAGLRDYVNA